MSLDNFRIKPGALERLSEGVLMMPLVTDRELARLVNMSDSWVRQQRSNRLHNRKHILTVDPVYVGDSPRYRREQVIAWFEGIATQETEEVGRED